jgi:mRNA interferase MazF
MVVRRGEIWWASLDEPRGSEPAYSRPVVIVQSDEFNRSRIQTVIAAVISSNLNLTRAPGNVFLRAKNTGLPKDSVANVSQLITVDKTFLSEKVGHLMARQLNELDEGLRLVLAV